MFFDNRFRQLPTAMHTSRHTSAHIISPHVLPQATLFRHFIDSYAQFFFLHGLTATTVETDLLDCYTYNSLHTAYCPTGRRQGRKKTPPAALWKALLILHCPIVDQIKPVLISLFSQLFLKHLLSTCTLHSTTAPCSQIQGKSLTLLLTLQQKPILRFSQYLSLHQRTLTHPLNISFHQHN